MRSTCFLAVALQVSLSVATVPARAELPLNIEEILTDKGKFKLELSISYANLESSGLSVGEPFVIQTGPTSFITLPTSIGERTANSDSLVGTAGLHYGLTSKTEVYARGNYLYFSQRGIETDGAETRISNKDWVDMWGGVNYRFKKDDSTPAIVGFAEIALYEKHTNNQSSFKSVIMGFTAYRAIDPVVLSLTASYQYNKGRIDRDYYYKPGILF